MFRQQSEYRNSELGNSLARLKNRPSEHAVMFSKTWIVTRFESLISDRRLGPSVKYYELTSLRSQSEYWNTGTMDT